MRWPALSVRVRLLALSVGLLAVLGTANLLLAYMIHQNQGGQVAQQEQYRRFEIIQATGQSMTWLRHLGGQLNSARLFRRTAEEAQVAAAIRAAESNLDAQLERMASFDTASVERIREALLEIPALQASVVDAMLARRPPENEPSVRELQRRLNLIEDTLAEASHRERSLARELHERERRRVTVAQRVAASIIVASGLGGLALTLLVIRSILRPLRETTDAIRQVNLGRIDIDLPAIRRDEFGDMALALRQFRDQAERLRKLAYEDALTGLGNRARLESDLPRAIDESRASGAGLALIHAGLDNFRAVNDRLGHKAGDRYLCEAASRLSRFVPVEAQLFRCGGDHFSVLVEGLSDHEPAQARLREIANDVLRGLGEPYPIGDQLLNMSVSVGIAIFPEDGQTTQQLISAADAAMYVAKKNGRNNLRFAGAQITGEFRRQLALASDIRRGLEAGEFEAFYQPIVDVERGVVVAAEALLRWRHPQRGLLLPSAFIGAAEESGLINRLGEQCLVAAHQQSQRWRSTFRGLRIAVNLSAHQIHEGQILEFLNRLDREWPATEQLIDFELTESTLLDANDSGQQVLEEIKRRGFRLSLDDFGTGYSSFSYLNRLPIDKLKIDQQFVASMSDSKQAVAIISAIVALARNLELDVVAEGVETDPQMLQLCRLGCSFQQGFRFSSALPAEEFPRWVLDYERQASTIKPVAGEPRSPSILIQR